MSSSYQHSELSLSHYLLMFTHILTSPITTYCQRRPGYDHQLINLGQLISFIYPFRTRLKPASRSPITINPLDAIPLHSHSHQSEA